MSEQDEAQQKAEQKAEALLSFVETLVIAIRKGQVANASVLVELVHVGADEVVASVDRWASA